MTNRELDELICEKVMGLKVIRNETEVPLGWYREVGRDFLGEPRPILDVHTWNATFEKHRGIGFRCTPGYSTDLNEAFRVIEKMREKDISTYMMYMPIDNPYWEYTIKMRTGGYGYKAAFEKGKSPARAICLCALKVVQEMENAKD